MRRGLPPDMRLTNASTRPFVSPLTRLEAWDRNATHDGFLRNAPLTAGEYDGPLAGAPLAVREISTFLPIFQAVPLLSIEPARLTTKTSLTPLVSPRTRFDASDSNAMTRA